MEFSDLKFGYSDGHREAQDAPRLLLDGFYDPWGMEDYLVAGRFIVLGPKGSGKSAFAAHMELQIDSGFLVRTIMLADFPFADFSSIQAGGVTKEARYPSAWAWLLNLALLSSFERDEAASFEDYQAFRTSLSTLRSVGWLPEDSLRPLIVENTKKSTIGFKLPFMNATDESEFSHKGIPFPAAIDTVSDLVLRFRSPTGHLLILDGLDDLIIQSTVQWEVLSALMVAVGRLNGKLKSAGLNAYVVVLCRSDIFDRLPGANTSKYRQDSAFALSWYQDIKDPRSSYLLALANRKASVEAPTVGDIFRRFFPPTFRLESGRRFDTVEYLLDYTRHTPRDFLRLLTYIGEAAKSRAATGTLSSSVIEAGVHNYAVDYFVGEMTNELYGFLPVESIELTKRLLRGLRRHRFYVHELEKKIASSSQYASFPVHDALTQLYEASVIGNAVVATNTTHIRFKYRNPHQTLDFDMQLVLHNALVNAFNTPRSGSGLL